MGYFPNGTAGEMYEHKYCSRCVHSEGDKGCTVWFLHMIHNYDECNKPDSFLHALIPRSESKLDNDECTMFVPSQT